MSLSPASILGDLAAEVEFALNLSEGAFVQWAAEISPYPFEAPREVLSIAECLAEWEA